MTALDTRVLADTVAEYGWPAGVGSLDVAAESVLDAWAAVRKHPDCPVRAGRLDQAMRNLADIRTEVAAGIARHGGVR